MAATADGTEKPTVLNGRELSKQIREKIRHEVSEKGPNILSSIATSRYTV